MPMAACGHALLGRKLAALPVGVSGVVFRLRLTTGGRRVESPPPVDQPDGPDRPLLGIDLRAGDEHNYPPVEE